MAILSKGTTFVTGNQVTAAGLNNLVDSATFASGAVDTVTMELGGNPVTLRVKDGGITTTKLSTGHPNWDVSSNVTVAGTLTVTGAAATAAITATSITASGNLACADLSPTGDVTILSTKSLKTSATIGRTVKLSSGVGGNDIQFGYQNDSAGLFLLVTIDGSAQYKITLTAV